MSDMRVEEEIEVARGGYKDLFRAIENGPTESEEKEEKKKKVKL